MPRNVVTVVAKRRPWRRASETQTAILKTLTQQRRRPDPDPDLPGRHVEFSFPMSTSRAAAKAEIAVLLNDIEPRWRRYFTLYPSDQTT
jgi:hypothetical protein